MSTRAETDWKPDYLPIAPAALSQFNVQWWASHARPPLHIKLAERRRRVFETALNR